MLLLEGFCIKAGFFSWLGKHITPEAVPLSKKSANAETCVGVTSRP